MILPDENSSKLKSLKITIRNPKIIGEKTKKCYQLGSLVNKIVKKTDLLKRQLDFILSDTLE